MSFSYAVSSGNEADLDLADFRRLSGRRSAHQTNRAVHRGYPAPGGLHARRRARTRGRQADPRDQDRRHATVAIRRTVAYRRHRRRLRCVSGDVRALRHRQLPFARRSFGSGAGLSVRTAAEGSAHRLCHHIGRHGRSALRLFRIRRRGDPGIFRRHPRGAAAVYAGGHQAEESARRWHSDDAQGRRRPTGNRRPRSRHRHGGLGVAAARQRRQLERHSRTSARAQPQPTSRSSRSAA